MMKMNRTHRTVAFSIVGASFAFGFLSWYVFLPIAFVGGYALARTNCTRFPAVSSAVATSLGWVIVAFARDMIESGRVSSKLAAFLSLPHAIFIYIVLFLMCTIPALFAAYSGTVLSSIYLTSNLREGKRAD